MDGLPVIRVLVFGGRDFRDRRWLYRVLDAFHARLPILMIIEGEASGADRLARQWADSRNILVDPYPADWNDLTVEGAVVRRTRGGKLYNAAAGPQRNLKMLHLGKPTHAIGFPGGSGTRDMASQCMLSGLRPRMLRPG